MKWYSNRMGSSLARCSIRDYLRDLEKHGLEVTRPFINNKRSSVIQEEEDEVEIPTDKKVLFDLAWDEYRSFIGMSKRHKPPKQAKSKVGQRRKIAVISDCHGKPHVAGIEAMLKEKPDLALLVGDITDLASCSRFAQELRIPIDQDLANVRAMLERISEVCPVEMGSGNHDRRLSSYFSNRIDADYMRFVWTNVLEMSAQGLENVSVVKNMHGFQTPGGHIFEEVLKTSFLIFQGDAVFGHAEAARKHELTTVRAFAEWYNNWRKPMMWPDASVIGQAHIHRAAVGFGSGGHNIMIELGTMLDPSVLQYTMESDIRYSPPVVGYTILEQTKKNGNWTTEKNSVRFCLV